MDNFDQQILLDANGDESYRLTPYPIKAQNSVRNFTPDEVENRFTQTDFTAQQLGLYRQRDWTNAIDKMKFKQLVDDTAEKIEVAQAINFAEQAQ